MKTTSRNLKKTFLSRLQEVDNDVLQLVNDSNKDSLRINYSKLVPVLVKAIQELKEEVELLKS